MKHMVSLFLVLTLLLTAVPAALADNAVVRLPDLMTFSDGQLRLTLTDTSKDFVIKYTLEGDAEAVTRVIDAYVALLDNCGDVTPDSRFPLGTGKRVVTYECEAAGVKRFTVSNSDEAWSVKGISLCIEQTSPTSLVFRVAAGMGFLDNGARVGGSAANMLGQATATPVGSTSRICDACGGDGIAGSCLQCGGDGQIEATGERCPACGGRGYNICASCGGTGRQ